MNRTTICRLPLVALAALVGIGRAAATDDMVLFSDSFADVNGYLISQTGGRISKQGESATRQLLPFMGLSPKADGKLTIAALEDATTIGFDGQPGVLAISLVSLPKAATYCGFAYLGGVTRDRTLLLPELVADPTLDNLKRITLRYRFKAVNPFDASASGATFAFRLEPMVPSSYASRLAFSGIQATDDWQLWEGTLDQALNVENFLKLVSADKPSGFKLIWAQAGPIANYQPGDTLLIDDIEFVRARR